MHISNISAVALKGQTFDHKLSPLTLITGANASGKTARIEAIRLALIGYIPELGKRNGDTYDLASGGRMSVQARINDPESLYERDFWLERGSVKTSSSVGIDLNTPLMDAEAYFGLTESQRVDYVFQRAKLPDTFTAAGIVAQLQRISLGEDHSEEHEQAKQDAIVMCQARFGKDDDIRAAIDQLHGNLLKTSEAEYKRRAADSIGAVRVLAELKNAESAPTAERMTDLQNKLSRADGLLEEAGKTLGRLYQQQDEAERTRSRREELERLLSQPTPAFPEPKHVEPAKPATINCAVASKNLEEIEARPQYHSKPGSEATDALPVIARKIGVAKQAHESACNAALAQERKIKDVTNHDSCPYCLSSQPGWAKTVVAKLEEELEGLRAAKDDAYTALCKLQDEEAILQSTAEIERESKAAWSKLQADADALRKQIERDSRTNADMLAHHARDLQSSKQEFERKKKEIAGAKEHWVTSMKNHQAELDRIQEVKPPTAEELQMAEQLVEERRADQNALRTKITTATKLQQDLVRAEQAARDHRLADAKAKVLKLVRAELTTIKAKMVEAAFRSMLDFANDVIRGILPFELAYDASRNEIGRYGASGFIPHSTFSGTEKALCYVAIAAALSAEAPFRLVLLDELGRIAESLRLDVADRMSELVRDGKLDQVIGVLPTDEPVALGFGNWERIHLA